MFDRFEETSNIKLMNNCPVILRLDGKNFSNWTRQLDGKFDEDFLFNMEFTTMFLLGKIQNAKFAYIQSDEISILLDDSATPETQSWFDNRIQKLTSISASMASAMFNSLTPSTFRLAFFDARAFNIPKELVVDYFAERRRNAIANSIQTLAQIHYSQAELNCKKQDDVLQMLTDANSQWSSLNDKFRFGVFVSKERISAVTSLDIFYENYNCRDEDI